jgi:hypothetical protein
MGAFQFTLINIILPLALGLIGSFAYPRVESYLKNRALSARQRQIKALLLDYEYAELLKDDMPKFTVILIGHLADVLKSFMGFLLLLALDAVGISKVLSFLELSEPSTIRPIFELPSIISLTSLTILTFGVGFFSGGIARQLYSIRTSIDNILGFKSFHKVTMSRLKKLGYKTDELDAKAQPKVKEE